MHSISHGKVIEVLSDSPDLQELSVLLDGAALPERAYNYPDLFRRISAGEIVSLNTSAVKLGLGTGGRHFVVPEASATEASNCLGHIMKLRYTPWQFPVLAAEEENSPLHSKLVDLDNLAGTPVVAAPLHSMIPGVIFGFRQTVQKGDLKIAYIMTDGAALPIALSGLVKELTGKKLIDLTITTGHAFGGDLETISLPSALVTARAAANPDLIIVAMGPGIVGSGTKLGFSGVEQSWVIDLVSKLNGIPVSVPRISTADSRPRHRGLSHHSATILNLANRPCHLGLSKLMPEELRNSILNQLKEHNILQNHHCYIVDDPPAAPLFKEYQLNVKTMGRGIDAEPWFFQATVTAGVLAGLAYQNKLDCLEILKE